MTASQLAASLVSPIGIRRLSATLIACLAAASALTACSETATATNTVVPETLTPISRSYAVESFELVEVSHFEDGSTRYMPTGWIVLSPLSTPTANAMVSGD